MPTANHKHDKRGPFETCATCWTTKMTKLTGGVYHPLKSTGQMAAEVMAIKKKEPAVR